MTNDIHTIAMEFQMPPRILGPQAISLDVHAYLVAHPAGVILIDTGMAHDGEAISAALKQTGASWDDLTHIVVTHAHVDHMGGLSYVLSQAPTATLLAHPSEGVDAASPLVEGEKVANLLRVLETPGHTAGHISVIDENSGALFVGDCLGSIGGHLQRAPALFTMDPALAEQSIRKFRSYRGARLLFAHAPELADAWHQYDEIVG